VSRREVDDRGFWIGWRLVRRADNADHSSWEGSPPIVTSYPVVFSRHRPERPQGFGPAMNDEALRVQGFGGGRQRQPVIGLRAPHRRPAISLRCQ